ncbi:uclacyanin-3-like [Cornus florida]|uniref:uclacyanin-3-like n=1 Tax=Cornus florida TaxID=4283 RepID=UPI002899AB6A|nr:uclacyanin-3-like [Cornus florida]
MALAAALLILLLASPAVYAADHTVGGSNGWSQTGDYTTWAKSQTFIVGDNLVFNYDSTHSVDEVSQSDYTNCKTSSPIKSYTGGSTTISLTTAGPMYFICPTFGHCQGGMKLAITVGASSPSPGGTPPATSSPPSSSSSPPPPTTSTTSSPPPPPPSSGATGDFGNSNVLMLVLALVLVGLHAYMG